MNRSSARPPLAPAVVWVAPFVLFMLFLPLVDLLESCGVERAAHFVYPVQTLACAGLLWAWRRAYCEGVEPSLAPVEPESIALTLGPVRRVLGRPGAGVLAGALVGLLVFALWVAPQALLGRAPRLEGFNPAAFAENSPAWWATLGFRFLRLAVVVPLVEELFWRGFLLRYLAAEFSPTPRPFQRLSVGVFSWKAFGLVALLFTLAHQPADYPAALLTGLLYNAVAVGTQRMAPCVAAHAVTNLLLGIYIMKTGQWGFW